MFRDTLTRSFRFHSVVLEQFLLWVKQQVPSFNPAQFMIDCSATEARALKAVFPTCRIFYCTWHFDRACKGQITKKVRFRYFLILPRLPS